MSNSNFGGPTTHPTQIPDHLLASARRAKSNSEAAFGKSAQQRTRRLRHQRKAQAVKQSEYNESCTDDISQRSFGAKSNLTTPMRTERPGRDSQQKAALPDELSTVGNDARNLEKDTTMSFNDRHSGSQLKQPTRLSKSP